MSLTFCPFSRRFILTSTTMLALSVLPPLQSAVQAQDEAAGNQNSAQSTVLGDAILQGIALFEANDIRALGVLSRAAQTALKELAAAPGGAPLLTAPPARIPESGPLALRARQAAFAHLWWGQAADKFAQRDVAVTALCRAYRLAGPNRFDTNRVSRDSVLALNGILRDGLPSVAPDDTLETLSTLSLWKPRRLTFSYPANTLAPALPARLNPSFPTVTHDLLVTQGKLFPPESAMLSTLGRDKTVVAPLYRGMNSSQLPGVLKLGYMAAGFVREGSGANRGQWKQVVRVFYAHSVLTKNNRDDRARAEALCEQFLKLYALSRNGLGLSNPYVPAPDGVTTLWLSDLSALWPLDDEDPAVQAQLGIRMPKPNIAAGNQTRVPQDVEWTALQMPWLAAGQVESAPGDIMFFKVGQPRPEAEWLRQLAHEYGHVILPPFGNFQPPAEPFANGLAGETLSLLWAAGAAKDFEVVVPAFVPPPTPTPTPRPATSRTGAAVRPTPRPATPASAPPLSMRDALYGHVAQNAVPALRLFNAQGPDSPLRAARTGNGLLYLQGLNVYLDRVYGARLLGATQQTLQQRTAASFKTLQRIMPTNTQALLENWWITMRDPFPAGQKYLPLWLPGALETLPANVPAGQLINRAPLLLRRGERITVRLFVPPSAKSLTVEWRGAAGAALNFTGPDAFPSTSRPAASANATGAAVVNVTNQPGWRRFSFAATNELTILNTWFERR